MDRSCENHTVRYITNSSIVNIRHIPPLSARMTPRDKAFWTWNEFRLYQTYICLQCKVNNFLCTYEADSLPISCSPSPPLFHFHVPIPHHHLSFSLYLFYYCPLLFPTSSSDEADSLLPLLYFFHFHVPIPHHHLSSSSASLLLPSPLFHLGYYHHFFINPSSAKLIFGRKKDFGKFHSYFSFYAREKNSK